MRPVCYATLRHCDGDGDGNVQDMGDDDACSLQTIWSDNGPFEGAQRQTERERERDRETATERERDRETQTAARKQAG